MGDYHFVYKDVEGASTQWDDIQTKLGNLPPKPPAFKPPPFTPSSDHQPKDKTWIDSQTSEELEDLEDDLDDDRFLQEYRLCFTFLFFSSFFFRGLVLFLSMVVENEESLKLFMNSLVGLFVLFGREQLYETCICLFFYLLMSTIWLGNVVDLIFYSKLMLRSLFIYPFFHLFYVIEYNFVRYCFLDLTFYSELMLKRLFALLLMAFWC